MLREGSKRHVLQHLLANWCWAVGMYYLNLTLLCAAEQQWLLLSLEHRSRKEFLLLTSSDTTNCGGESVARGPERPAAERPYIENLY